MKNPSLLDFAASLQPNRSVTSFGSVVGVRGPLINAHIPSVALGDICTIALRTGMIVTAEVVSFDKENCLLAPVGTTKGISPGDSVKAQGGEYSIALPSHLFGSVITADGAFLHPPLQTSSETIHLPIFRAPPSPLSRKPISEVFASGVAAIDGLLTLGKGQRIGLFASAGLGKSTLLGMIAKHSDHDVCVIALIGERGREIQEFITDTLGEEGMRKTIIIASTSDESPMKRRVAGYLATSIAEHYRDKGKNVLLLFDSLTRFSRAVRDVAVSAGELPLRQGYPAAVYGELPILVERAGSDSVGSITAVYTVLTNTEKEVDPLGDEIKSLLDGHICLSKRVSDKGVYPAIDILNSISRLNDRFHSKTALNAQIQLRQYLARLERDKDLLIFGGEADDELKEALQAEKKIYALLKQSPNECATFLNSMNSVYSCVNTMTSQN